MKSLKRMLLQGWQKPNWLSYLLLPVSCLYYLLTSVRTALFKLKLLRSYYASVPVIVVGNITLGGTGKTPMVIFLVQLLRDLGYKPGVISRGYFGRAKSYPLEVTHSTPVEDSGDEAKLIVSRTGVPMMVDADRQAAIEALLQSYDVNIIISDDGLQHLKMQRDIEICLLDQTNDTRNEFLFPAGPYREPRKRLAKVDLVVNHRNSSVPTEADESDLSMYLQAGQPTQIMGSETNARWSATAGIHAVAGIGNPHRFFATCESLKYQFEPHVFDDHHHFIPQDLEFGDDKAILMTEKDAVKCQKFANQKFWYLPVDAKLSKSFVDQFSQLLEKRCLKRVA